MRQYRREWFARVLQREHRIADIAALNSLLTGATFFASTSILILGGLVAMLGATSRVSEVVAELPYALPETESLSRIKTVLLIGMFVYAFFKFTWSIRQYHFCTILVGAAPVRQPHHADRDYVETLTRVSSHAAQDFNQGLRTFYFALAALAWFFHPWLSVCGSAAVVYVLYQREFRSRTLHALATLQAPGPAHGQSPHLPAGGSSAKTSPA
jgi:uncharacterized membrane protein